MSPSVQISAVPDVPDIAPGDDLGEILGRCLATSLGAEDGDILCVAHKVISKAEGNLVDMDQVTPSDEATELATRLNKRPEKVEVILNQSVRVVRAFKRPQQHEGVMICEHRLGFISANAAVDESNSQPGTLVTLPEDPDASATRLGEALEARFGVSLGIVVTDTFGRPWRLGQTNVAIGLYRVPATVSNAGELDAWGRPLSVTEPALADELAAASGLVVGKASKTPLVLFRGVRWNPVRHASARDILRSREEDMFT